MNPRQHLLKKYNIKTDVIEIPNAGRNELADFIRDMRYIVGAEIGVAAGEYSDIIMRKNPQLIHMFGVDPHLPYQGYRDYVRLGTFDGLEKQAHDRLDRFPNYEFIKEFSVEASKDFREGELDFVYIDANHSEPYITQDIETWTPLVREGGIVAGHDYARIRGNNGEDSGNWAVIPAITKYAKENGYQLFIWGLEAKLPGLIRDASRSWMFVK